MDANSSVTIPKFYENKNIFITGATGFVGRILVEKLLRSCPGVKNIYVLLRPKKGNGAVDRIKDIIDIPLFETLKQINEKAVDKIIPISGDINEVGLGISDEDRKVLIENVTIIFHVAASLRFDDSLKTAAMTNVRSTREIMVLAGELKKIDCCIHTSTAYSNCENFFVKEEIYPTKWNWKEFLCVAEQCDERTLEIMTQTVLKPSRNTYLFTKSIAENVVQDLSLDRIPAAIVRPSIIITTQSDPIPGWVDNFNGTCGFIFRLTYGIIRVDNYNIKNTFYDQVFADNVVKALLISGWKKGLSGDTHVVDIYNVTSDFNTRHFLLRDWGIQYMAENPMRHQMRSVNITSPNSFYLFYFFTILYHIIPALLIDQILVWFGMQRRLLKLFRRYYITCIFVNCFQSNSWTFENKSYLMLREILLPEDSDSFYFQHYGTIASQKDIDKFLVGIFDGVRTYLGKEGPVTQETRDRINRIKKVEKIWSLVWYSGVFYLLFIKFQLITLFANILCRFFE